MDPTTTPMDPVSRPKPNGILARNHHHHPIIRLHHPPSPPPPPLYRECVKNHAAALGGHALDGCCEFMPSPSSNPSDPSSLTCAACGCHRNFHRRADHGCGAEDSGGGGASSHNDDTDDGGGRRRSASPPPPSAPHMLLALSAAGEGLSPPAAAAGPAGPTPSKKRFRSKFSPEQKDRMQELSERLGWRMQRRDEGIIEQVCREIGVGRRVFKVWMHNNKHNFILKNTTTPTTTTTANSNGSSSNAAGDGIDGESHVLHHHHNHHHHRDNGVSGSADSSP